MWEVSNALCVCHLDTMTPNALPSAFCCYQVLYNWVCITQLNKHDVLSTFRFKNLFQVQQAVQCWNKLCVCVRVFWSGHARTASFSHARRQLPSVWKPGRKAQLLWGQRVHQLQGVLQEVGAKPAVHCVPMSNQHWAIQPVSQFEDICTQTTKSRDLRERTNIVTRRHCY